MQWSDYRIHVYTCNGSARCLHSGEALSRNIMEKQRYDNEHEDGNGYLPTTDDGMVRRILIYKRDKKPLIFSHILKATQQLRKSSTLLLGIFP
jgi:hypothetical protein